MTTEADIRAGCVREILKDPDHDDARTARLVLADWLEEHDRATPSSDVLRLGGAFWTAGAGSLWRTVELTGPWREGYHAPEYVDYDVGSIDANSTDAPRCVSCGAAYPSCFNPRWRSAGAPDDWLDGMLRNVGWWCRACDQAAVSMGHKLVRYRNHLETYGHTAEDDRWCCGAARDEVRRRAALGDKGNPTRGAPEVVVQAEAWHVFGRIGEENMRLVTLYGGSREMLLRDNGPVILPDQRIFIRGTTV
jgi:uncharacterized protein (TIGR02996 family)